MYNSSIHPPADDVPGRRIGRLVARRTAAFVARQFAALFGENASDTLVWDAPDNGWTLDFVRGEPGPRPPLPAYAGDDDENRAPNRDANPPPRVAFAVTGALLGALLLLALVGAVVRARKSSRSDWLKVTPEREQTQC